MIFFFQTRGKTKFNKKKKSRLDGLVGGLLPSLDRSALVKHHTLLSRPPGVPE